jgi:hypothetical protein
VPINLSIEGTNGVPWDIGTNGHGPVDLASLNGTAISASNPMPVVGNFGITNASDHLVTNINTNPLFTQSAGKGSNDVAGFEVATTNLMGVTASNTALTNYEVLDCGIITNFFRTAGGSTTLQSLKLSFYGTNNWVPVTVHLYSKVITSVANNGYFAPTPADNLYHIRGIPITTNNVTVFWNSGAPTTFANVTNFSVFEGEANLGCPCVNKENSQNLYYVIVGGPGLNLTNATPLTGAGPGIWATGFQDQ